MSFNLFTKQNAIDFMNTRNDNMFPCSTYERARGAVDSWLISCEMKGKVPGRLLNYIGGPKNERQAIEHFAIMGAEESNDTFVRCSLKCPNCTSRMIYNQMCCFKSNLYRTKEDLKETKEELKETKEELKKTKEEIKRREARLMGMMNIIRKEMLYICNNELKDMKQRLESLQLDNNKTEDSLSKHIKEVESRNHR